MLPDCKTKDESEGREQWNKFANAIIAWRRQKISIFDDLNGLVPPGPKQLRDKLTEVYAELKACREGRGLVKVVTKKEKDSVALKFLNGIRAQIDVFCSTHSEE